MHRKDKHRQHYLSQVAEERRVSVWWVCQLQQLLLVLLCNGSGRGICSLLTCCQATRQSTQAANSCLTSTSRTTETKIYNKTNTIYIYTAVYCWIYICLHICIVYMQVGVARALADSSDFWASGGAKFPKMWDSLPWTPSNRRAKCDDASFILGGEIHNHTNTKNKQKQKVNDISTPCLSARVYKQQTPPRSQKTVGNKELRRKQQVTQVRHWTHTERCCSTGDRPDLCLSKCWCTSTKSAEVGSKARRSRSSTKSS